MATDNPIPNAPPELEAKLGYKRARDGQHYLAYERWYHPSTRKQLRLFRPDLRLTRAEYEIWSPQRAISVAEARAALAAAGAESEHVARILLLTAEMREAADTHRAARKAAERLLVAGPGAQGLAAQVAVSNLRLAARQARAQSKLEKTEQRQAAAVRRRAHVARALELEHARQAQAARAGRSARLAERESRSVLKPVDARLQPWVDHLLASGRSQLTIKSYLWQIEHWLADGGRFDAQPADLVAWLARRRIGRSNTTLKSGVSALRSLFGFLRPADNPALKLPWPKLKKKKQRVLNSEQAITLLASCDTSTPKGLRDLALLSLMLDSGLRAAEVCRLQMADLDLRERSLVVTIKGGSEGTGVFSELTAQYLAQWIEARAALALPGVATVFIALRGLEPGAPLTPDGLRTVFTRMGQAVGIEHLSPHQLRRAFATMALRAGAPSRIVQAAGRWSDIRFVELYSPDITARDFDQYSPMARLMQLPGAAAPAAAKVQRGK